MYRKRYKNNNRYKLQNNLTYNSTVNSPGTDRLMDGSD